MLVIQNITKPREISDFLKITLRVIQGDILLTEVFERYKIHIFS